jgi:hypothetical protein
MFWRHDCCCGYHRWRSFRRGMTAMFMLVIGVFALLNYHPAPAHHRADHHKVRHEAKPHHVNKARLAPRPTSPKDTKPADRHHRDDHSRAPKHRRPASPLAKTTGSPTAMATAGQSLTWSSFGGMALPSSPTAGPYQTRHGLATGFARSPRGALLAAINIAVRTASQWGPSIYEPTIETQVTGPGTADLLAADNRAYARLQDGTRAHQTASLPASAAEEAYRFLSYSPNTATLNVVTIGPAGNGTQVLAVTRLQVVWQHGDWRLVAPAKGDWANASTALTSLTGYVLLSGER